jgi:hypothetical protein
LESSQASALNNKTHANNEKGRSSFMEEPLKRGRFR